MSVGYATLSQGSLNGGSQLSNGLQTTAIYWETWQTSFSGLFGGLYGGKWSWKTLDDDIRRFIRLDASPASYEGVLFSEVTLSEGGYVRQYDGLADFSTVIHCRRRSNFTFFPTGVARF